MVRLYQLLSLGLAMLPCALALPVGAQTAAVYMAFDSSSKRAYILVLDTPGHLALRYYAKRVRGKWERGQEALNSREYSHASTGQRHHWLVSEGVDFPKLEGILEDESNLPGHMEGATSWWYPKRVLEAGETAKLWNKEVASAAYTTLLGKARNEGPENQRKPVNAADEWFW